jgi:hypothetical protein
MGASLCILLLAWSCDLCKGGIFVSYNEAFACDGQFLLKL